jgi:hypothetical protein
MIVLALNKQILWQQIPVRHHSTFWVEKLAHTKSSRVGSLSKKKCVKRNLLNLVSLVTEDELISKTTTIIFTLKKLILPEIKALDGSGIAPSSVKNILVCACIRSLWMFRVSLLHIRSNGTSDKNEERR